MSVFHSGMMMSFYGIGTIAGSIIGGKLSDRISPNLISIFCLLVQAIAFVGITQIQSLYFLMGDLFIVGLASYGFITSNHTWVLSRCQQGESQRLKAINLLSVASNLGMGISAIIIGMFNTQAFISILLTSSTLLLLMAIYLSYEEAAGKNKIFLEKNNTDIKMHGSIQHVPLMVFTLSCLFMAGVIVSQTSSTYSIYLLSIFPGMGMKSFSILFILNTFMVVLFQTSISNYFAEKNKVLMIGLGAFLLGFGMCLLSVTFNFSIAILAAIIMTVGEMIFFSMSFLACYESSAQNKKGQSIGLYRMIYAVSRIAGPVAGGAIYDNFGAEVLWYACGIIGCCALLAAYLFNRVESHVCVHTMASA